MKYNMTKTLVLLSALLAAACGPAEVEPTSDTNIFNPRDISSAPDFVRNSLVLVSIPLLGSACSGTIVAPRKILTAAHCVPSNSQPSNFQIVFGDGSRRTPTALKRNSRADIAVLTIDSIPASSRQSPVKVHGELVGSIQPGFRVIIAGVGDTIRGRNDAGIRRWGKTVFNRFVGNYQAASGESYSSGLFFTPDAACSGSDPACANACSGDSGGPVYQFRPNDGWGVIGVMSTGNCEGPSSDQRRMTAADARSWVNWIFN